MECILIPPIPKLYRELSIYEWINSSPKYADFKIGHILQFMFKQLLDYIYTQNLKLNCKAEVFWTHFCNFVYVNRYKDVRYKCV